MFMKIDMKRLKSICAGQDLTLSELLQSAGVSRNAFYTLARQDSILPRSIQVIANHLQIPPSSFLADEGSDTQKGMNLIRRVRNIVNHHELADPDNIRHTLILLEEKPVERLRRALLRARRFNIQR